MGGSSRFAHFDIYILMAYSGGSMGKYETSTSSSGMAGRGANEGEISSGNSAGNLHNISSQGIEGMRNQRSASGPVGSNISGKQMETGKASMADKIIGKRCLCDAYILYPSFLQAGLKRWPGK